MQEFSERTVRELLDAAPDATVIVNAEGKIVFANVQIKSVFGYEPNELLGLPVENLLPQRFRNTHPSHRKSFFDNPKPRPMGVGLELHGLSKDGIEFPIEISLSPVRTDEGLLVCGAIRDITAKKEAERELLLARNIAESATNAKSRFLAAASHDLRQPLQSLGLYLSVMTHHLEKQGLPDQADLKDVSSKMRNSIDSMGELLDTLLDISTLEGGSLTPEKRDINIKELLDRIVTDNKLQADLKGLLLECTTDDCVVRSDPALLKRVIENFVTNAIHYTQKGQVRIDFKRVNGAVQISVADSGIGIPKDKLDAVFEEYYQLDNPVRDRSKGLGLGLSIVKHIARLLDHQISVSSVAGEGSIFSVKVPLSVEMVASIEPPSSADDPPHRGKETIVLFIDDDPAVVDATTMFLSVSGFHVHPASNGEEALALIAGGVLPDILVSDFWLPGFNGVELVRRIRQALLRDLPAIILTGDTSAKEFESAKLSNCAVLHKPVDTEKLISLIKSNTV